jgi:hydroxyethylthiazole kinase-like uncharacterized protein yjeF
MGLPAASLMEQAASQISKFLTLAINKGDPADILFLCGPGNNGADAIAAARQLLNHPQITPMIHLPGGSPSPQSLLELQYSAYKNLGGKEVGDLEIPLQQQESPPVLVIDGLFGVGLGRPVEGKYAEALEAASLNEAPCVAVDCPSGLDCDSGEVLGCSLPAQWTISFIGAKLGFTRNQGPSLCGEVHIADIGVRRELAEGWLKQHRRVKQG